MKLPWLIIPPVIVTSALVVWFVDPFSVAVIGGMLIFWFGVPCLLIAGFLLLYAKMTGSSRRGEWKFFWIVVGFCGFIGLTIPANYFVFERAAAAAKAYPARVVPLLEAYRKANGRYPNSLAELPDAPPVPRLIRDDSYGYRSDGESYGFSFGRPGGLIDVWIYNPQTGEWDLSD